MVYGDKKPSAMCPCPTTAYRMFRVDREATDFYLYFISSSPGTSALGCYFVRVGSPTFCVLITHSSTVWLRSLCQPITHLWRTLNVPQQGCRRGSEPCLDGFLIQSSQSCVFRSVPPFCTA